MKKTLTLLLSVLTLFCTLPAIAQPDWDVPEDVVYKTAKDYENYEEDIVKAAEWLEETDLTKQKQKRAKANLFVLNWVEGSSNVTINLNSNLFKLFKGNDDFLGLYFASYSKHCLLADSVIETEAIKTALNSLIKVYNKGSGITKNKKMKKLAAMTDAELLAYIDEKLLVKKK